MVDAALADYRSAPISPRLRAALRLIEAMTLDAPSIDRAFIEGVKAEGLSDAEIEDAANVGFHFNLINRLADAFDFPHPTAEQQRRLVRFLDLGARVVGRGQRPSPSWVEEEGVLRPVEVALGRATMLTTPGETTEAERRAIEAISAAAMGAHRPEAPPLDEMNPEAAFRLPGASEDEATLLERSARYAYKVTDELVDGTLAAGRSEVALFELVMAATFGASCAGIEAVFGALYGEA